MASNAENSSRGPEVSLLEGRSQNDNVHGGGGPANSQIGNPHEANMDQMEMLCTLAEMIRNPPQQPPPALRSMVEKFFKILHKFFSGISDEDASAVED